MKFSIIAVILGPAMLLASAQTSLPPCANLCASRGLALDECKSYDFTCVCGSTWFLDKILDCLLKECNREDLAVSVEYAKMTCLSADVTLPQIHLDRINTVLNPPSKTTTSSAVGSTNIPSRLDSGTTNAEKSTVFTLSTIAFAALFAF